MSLVGQNGATIADFDTQAIGCYFVVRIDRADLIAQGYAAGDTIPTNTILPGAICNNSPFGINSGNGVFGPLQSNALDGQVKTTQEIYVDTNTTVNVVTFVWKFS